MPFFALVSAPHPAKGSNKPLVGWRSRSKFGMSNSLLLSYMRSPNMAAKKSGCSCFSSDVSFGDLALAFSSFGSCHTSKPHSSNSMLSHSLAKASQSVSPKGLLSWISICRSFSTGMFSGNMQQGTSRQFKCL